MGQGATKVRAGALDPQETRFRLRMAEEALSHRGSSKTRMEEAQRVLRRVNGSDLPAGEARDRYIWLERALARYQTGELVSATALKWFRQQVAEVRQALPPGATSAAPEK